MNLLQLKDHLNKLLLTGKMKALNNPEAPHITNNTKVVFKLDGDNLPFLKGQSYPFGNPLNYVLEYTKEADKNNIILDYNGLSDEGIKSIIGAAGSPGISITASDKMSVNINMSQEDINKIAEAVYNLMKNNP